LSTDFYSIVDRDATVDEAFELAPRVIEWLLAEGVAAGPAQRRITHPHDERPFVGLRPEDPAVGYKPGPSLAKWVESPNYVKQTSGIEIRIGRHVHADPGSFPPDHATCPNGHDVPLPEGWIDAVSDWHETGSARLTCPTCGIPSSITGWSFGREFGLSVLAIEFLDPPGIASALVEEIGRLVAPHRVQLVFEHI
jgi:hypothetical protein